MARNAAQAREQALAAWADAMPAGYTNLHVLRATLMSPPLERATAEGEVRISFRVAAARPSGRLDIFDATAPLTWKTLLADMEPHSDLLVVATMQRQTWPGRGGPVTRYELNVIHMHAAHVDMTDAVPAPRSPR